MHSIWDFNCFPTSLSKEFPCLVVLHSMNHAWKIWFRSGDDSASRRNGRMNHYPAILTRLFVADFPCSLRYGNICALSSLWNTISYISFRTIQRQGSGNKTENIIPTLFIRRVQVTSQFLCKSHGTSFSVADDYWCSFNRLWSTCLLVD